MPDYKTTRSKRRTIPDWPAVQRAEDTGRALIDLWREYAAYTAQPYALSAFRKEFRKWRAIAPAEPSAEYAASDRYWQGRTSPRPDILVLDDGATLRARGGQLEVYSRGIGSVSGPSHPAGCPIMPEFLDDDFAGDRGRTCKTLCANERRVLGRTRGDESQEITKPSGCEDGNAVIDTKSCGRYRERAAPAREYNGLGFSVMWTGVEAQKVALCRPNSPFGMFAVKFSLFSEKTSH